MNKFKLFVENFLVYGLGGIISKIVPLVMLPVITLLMPNTAYFGISDMSNTIVSFASAIAIMGMYDAMYRLFFEKEDVEYQKRVCSTAFLFTMLTSILVFIVMLVFHNQIAEIFLGDAKYGTVIYITAIATLVGATNSIISAPTRMQNKRKIFLVTNTVSPLLSYGISIPMLLAGHYIIALPLAGVVSSLVMEISFGVLNRKWFYIKGFDKKILKSLLVIGVPLLPNFLIYWVFNSCDRVMITNMIDIGASGIYAIGSKLGHASQLIYTAFAGGWQFFAFSTMKETNQVENNSRIFEYLGVLSFVCTAFVCAWSYIIYKLLFPEEYLQGYIVAPYLFLAPLLQMLFQVAANQFLIIKKTWPNMLILLLGAVINIFLNLVMIPVLGIEGAAIATLVGYVISDIIALFVLFKMKLMIISRRFAVISMIMIFYFVIWRCFFSNNSVISTICALVVSFFAVILYKKDLLFMIKGTKSSVQK